MYRGEIFEIFTGRGKGGRLNSIQVSRIQKSRLRYLFLNFLLRNPTIDRIWQITGYDRQPDIQQNRDLKPPIRGKYKPAVFLLLRTKDQLVESVKLYFFTQIFCYNITKITKLPATTGYPVSVFQISRISCSEPTRSQYCKPRSF